MDSAIVTLDISTFFMLGLGFLNLLVIGPVAWILKGALRDLKQLEHNHTALIEALPKEYVRYDAHNRAMDRIEEKLDKIYSKLDSKADK